MRRTSKPASILAGAVGTKAVSSYFVPRFWLRAYASSWVRNSLTSSVKLRLSSGRWVVSVSPAEPGHSQSRSIPSNTPAAAPAPPRVPSWGRLPLM